MPGKTNKDIVGRINRHDGEAVGLCGIDAHVLKVKRSAEGGVDLGLVGEVTGVNTVYLNLLLDNGIMPVIAPIGVNDACEPHNINADVAASAIAAKLRAEKLVFLSDVEGVMAAALAAGVNKVHLIDGRIKHSILLEIFTDLGIGTELIHAGNGTAVTV